MKNLLHHSGRYAEWVFPFRSSHFAPLHLSALVMFTGGAQNREYIYNLFQTQIHFVKYNTQNCGQARTEVNFIDYCVIYRC